jgi:PAS domain S-box-containing protein
MQEQRKTHQEILNRLNRRLRTLHRCNNLFFQAESEQELLQSICEILVAGGELRLAWIGYCEDDTEKTIRPVAQAGLGLDYPECVRISWGEEKEAGQGPVGIAVRTGKASWVHDIRTDPRASPWRDEALARGYASCIALPLIADGKARSILDLRGTLNLYSAESNAFDESAVEHYTGLATSLTYAVSTLRSHLVDDLTHGVTRLRASDERKRTQEELRRSAAYLAEAQRLSRTGSFGWNVSSGGIFWSEESFRIFEYDRTTKPTLELFFQRFHPEDADLVKQTIDRASQDRKDFGFEHRLLMPNGSVKYVHVVAHALNDESGRIEFVGALMDVTERKRAEQALQNAQTELAHVTRVTTLGEMTASIAHEINQPLAAVVTNGSACLRWLMGESPNLEEAREASRRVIRDGNRASEVIARIRALMQKTETQKAQLNINEAIQEIVLLTQHEAERKGVRLRLELAAELPPVFGDRVQLQQVALNLVMNGVEAMTAVSDRPRELVIYSRAHESDQVLVAVQDCGMGIDQEDLEKIFIAFYTTKSQGMGMGLAISRSIIEAHGGRLWATPNEGEGATTQFTLPLSNQSK